MGSRQCKTELSDHLLQQEHSTTTQSMSSRMDNNADHSQHLQVEDPSATMQDTAVQTSHFLKEEDEEMSIEKIIQDGNTCQLFKSEAEEVLCEPVRKKAKLVPLTSQMQQQDNALQTSQIVKQESAVKESPALPENAVPVSQWVKREQEIFERRRQAFTTERNSHKDVALRLVGAFSELAANIVQALRISRMMQSAQTSRSVKAEAEEMSIHQDTDNVNQINCHLVKKEENPLTVLPENTMQTSQAVKQESDAVKNETDDSLQMSQAFTPEQNAENMLPQINACLNQENAVNLPQFVKEEPQEMLMEAETDCNNPQLVPEETSPVAPENQVQTSEFAKAEAEEMPPERETQGHVIRQPPAFANTGQNARGRFAQRTDNLREACYELARVTAQLKLEIKKQQYGRRIKQENVQAEEMSVEPNQNVHQIKTDEKPVLVLSENRMQTTRVIKEETTNSTLELIAQNGQHELSNNFVKNETDESLQMSQTFSPEQNTEDLLSQINERFSQLLPAEENMVNLSQLIKQETLEMSMEAETQDDDHTIPEETSQIVPENQGQTSQFVKVKTEGRSFEQETRDNVIRQSPAFANTDQNARGSIAQGTDSLREVWSELLRVTSQLMLEMWKRKDGRRRIKQENILTEDEEMSMEPNQNVTVKKEEDEDPFPILPENAYPATQFVKQEIPNPSTEPMIQNDQRKLSNPIVKNEILESLQMRQFLKEESEDDTQDDDNNIPGQNVQNPSTEATNHPSEDDSFSVTHHEKFNSIEVKHNLDFSRDAADFGAYYSNIMNSLKVATKKSLTYAKQGDKIQIELRNVDLQKNVSVTLANINDLSCLNTLFDRLGEANTSVNRLEMVVQIVKAPVGGVKRKLEDTKDCELLKRKRKHLHIPRNCKSQLSFAVSLAHCLNPDIDDSQAAHLGAQMQRRVGLTEEIPVTLTDVVRFELFLNRKIVVFYRPHNGTTFGKFMTLFRRTEDPPVFLYLHQSQYFGIRNITAFLGCNYFCKNCFQELGCIKNHSCPRCCPICLDPGCVGTEDKITCKDCNRKCRSRNCYEAHKKTKWCLKAEANVAECERRKRCKKCNYLYFSPSRGNFKHNCLLKRCSTCGVNFENNKHECYILPSASAQNHSESKQIFYEFKTYIDESGKKVPFVLSAKTLQGKTWTVYGEQCIVDFLRYFKSKAFWGTTFVSHHTDSSILLNNVIELGLNPNVITQNGKIVCIELLDFKQKFVDAAVFLPMPLTALPDMFRFNMYKGFFPVGFISKANLQYVGPCPAPEFYAVEEMSEKRRQEFDEAYHLASICEFDFKREAQIYCEDDVDILTTACVKLRTFFISGYNVDPFSCATLQSFGMNVFCSKFLPEKSLAIPLVDDCEPKKNAYSDASIEWLEWVMFSQRIFIQHPLNKGHKQAIKLQYVDGYSLVKGEKVGWKFVHCQQNGCPVCFPNVDHGERYKLCEERLARLTFLSNFCNVKLVVMREHTWNEMKKSNPCVREFLTNYKPPQPLALHELSYSNMSGVVKLQYSAASDEEIMFVEVDSLFPYVMANNPYPIGHPKLIFEKFSPPRSYFGLIKAVVFPPKDLLFPVLPYKTANGKTVFALCRSCADMNQHGPCNHTDKERALTGVWVTPEFSKALQMGYKLRNIIEVWHFETKSNTIFEDFVNNFDKGKQGGFDSPVAMNPAKNHIYKSSLDEFWQGFGDKSPQLQNEIVTKNADFIKFMFSDERKVEFFKILSDKTALVQWTPNQNTKSVPEKTDNIFVTAFTAAYGRLHLYTILEKLQEKVLYYDTDRVIYVAKGGQNELESGSAPGQLTNKLGGDTIQEFVSVGPKCYAYQTKTKQVVLNAKGITQTLENCEDVNFSVKDLVRGNVASSEMIKAVYDQRLQLPNGNTVPFGYHLDCMSTLDWALNQMK